MQKSSTDCGVSERDSEGSLLRRSCPSRGCCVMEKYCIRSTLFELAYGNNEL